jgi:hypothetical protein
VAGATGEGHCKYTPFRVRQKTVTVNCQACGKKNNDVYFMLSDCKSIVEHYLFALLVRLLAKPVGCAIFAANLYPRHGQKE